MKALTCVLSVTLTLAGLTGSAQAEKKDIVDTAVSAGSFGTLVTAVKAAGLVETLKGEGPFTVFAPTDDAFAKLPEGTIETLLKPENKGLLTSILTYHVVPGSVKAAQVVKLSGAATVNGQHVDIQVGEGVMIDGAKVITTDIECTNGVIHVIDTVILPEDKSIVGVAKAAGVFNTLITAAAAADLAGVLDEQGPFTVFAPTDDAFAKLPEGTVESLLKPENKEKLAAILKYHVVSGKVYAADALQAGEAATLEGNVVVIGVKDGAARVNNAALLKTDIDAANGVIHVIDAVLLPPADEQVQEKSVSHAPCSSASEGATVGTCSTQAVVVQHERPRLIRRMFRRGH